MILSIGKNSYVKTHPMMQRLGKRAGVEHKMCLHAEIDAIVKCQKLDTAHRILVIGTDANGRYKASRPCKICMEGIKSTPIQVIEYSITASELEIVSERI